MGKVILIIKHSDQSNLLYYRRQQHFDAKTIQLDDKKCHIIFAVLYNEYTEKQKQLNLIKTDFWLR